MTEIVTISKGGMLMAKGHEGDSGDAGNVQYFHIDNYYIMHKQKCIALVLKISIFTIHTLYINNNKSCRIFLNLILKIFTNA